MTAWREGARSGVDACPGCGAPCAVAWDFKKMGKHALRCCLACMKIHVDGEFADNINPEVQ